jgi:hypothetical protein
MTKRTVQKSRARTKPRTERAGKGSHAAVARGTEKPVDSEIRRAAERAGIPPREPRGITFEEGMKLNPAEQHEKLLRQVGHTDDAFIAGQLRVMAQQFSDRAIALDASAVSGWRAAVSIPTVRVGLVRACDRVGELIASAEENDGDTLAFLRDALPELLRDLWSARWELGAQAADISEAGVS